MNLLYLALVTLRIADCNSWEQEFILFYYLFIYYYNFLFVCLVRVSSAREREGEMGF
jgi:hypothetical protein